MDGVLSLKDPDSKKAGQGSKDTGILFPLSGNQMSLTPQHAKLNTQQPSCLGSPELTLASNPLRSLEFGVKVVVGPSHLTNADPVLPFKRQLEGTPAQAGG